MVENMGFEQHIDEKSEVETKVSDLLNKSLETGETVEIVHEIPIGTIKEKVRWVEKYENAISVFITESLELEDKQSKKIINFNKFLNKDTILVRFSYNLHLLEKGDEKIDPYYINPVFGKDGGIKYKLISYGSLSENGSRLSLLHEIGHDHEPTDLTSRAYSKKMR